MTRRKRQRQRNRWRDIVVVAAAAEEARHDHPGPLAEQARPTSPFVDPANHPRLLGDADDMSDDSGGESDG